MPGSAPVRLIRNEFELQDLVTRAGRDASLIERDFALMTVAAGLVAEYGDGLCFKGGFVLRHVHGHERFSKDIDATRINPPKHKLDAREVADAIRRASVRNLMTLTPGVPATDSGRSMDFDSVRYAGPLGKGVVSVEVSYREDVVEAPDMVAVGEPYYEPFLIPVMKLSEIVAEKLRALAQRDRPTDLADLAMILRKAPIDQRRVRVIAGKKFELVRSGDHRVRIEDTIARLGVQYDEAVGAVAPDAPPYVEAAAVVLGKLSALLP
jgi:predicted nucleotidyltransferase component of viral defense system